VEPELLEYAGLEASRLRHSLPTLSVVRRGFSSLAPGGVDGLHVLATLLQTAELLFELRADGRGTPAELFCLGPLIMGLLMPAVDALEVPTVPPL
jgi:hypothetical protein